MKLAYDKTTDSIYIHLADSACVDSHEVRESIVLGYDASGALVGIDVQHASKNADICNLSLSKLLLGQLEAA